VPLRPRLCGMVAAIAAKVWALADTIAAPGGNAAAPIAPVALNNAMRDNSTMVSLPDHSNATGNGAWTRTLDGRKLDLESFARRPGDISSHTVGTGLSKSYR
jgi:hypothetical protein